MNKYEYPVHANEQSQNHHQSSIQYADLDDGAVG